MTGPFDQTRAIHNATGGRALHKEEWKAMQRVYDQAVLDAQGETCADAWVSTWDQRTRPRAMTLMMAPRKKIASPIWLKPAAIFLMSVGIVA